MAVYQNRSREIAERLIKLRDYLRTNATPTHPAKAKDILEYLGNVTPPIKIKTLYSDIHTLQNFFNVELVYDEHQKGYILTNPDFEPYELRLIVNSIQAAKFITQKEADKLTSKIMGLADEYTRPSLKRQTYIPNRVRTINEEAMKGLDTIYEAIAMDRKIRFKFVHYFKDNYELNCAPTTPSTTFFITSPHKVIWTGNQYRIIATRKLMGRETIAFWQLEYMEQIEIISEKREGKSDPSIQELDDYFTRKINPLFPFECTKLKVPHSFVSKVIEKFGTDITMQPIDDEYFVVSIKTPPTPDLYMWTIYFSPRIEIIYPEDANSKLQSYFLELSKGNAPEFPYGD